MTSSSSSSPNEGDGGRSSADHNSASPILPLVENAQEDEEETDDDEYCEIWDEYGSAALESFCELDEDDDNSDNDEQGAPHKRTHSSFRWIRLENEKDASIRSLASRQDVLQRIQRAREQQSKLGEVHLYPRIWEYQSRQQQQEEKETVRGDKFPVVVNGDCGSNENEEEEEEEAMVVNGSAQPVSNCHNFFSVLQFNSLAEGLSQGPNARPPFRVDPNDAHAQTEKQTFGGFTEIPFPEETLSFDVRRWRLLEILLGGGLMSSENSNNNNSSNSSSHHQHELQLGEGAYDIIAAEEMDRFWGFFAPLLNIFGYRGIFAPKTRSPGVRMGWYSDGCALFWKDRNFELLSEKRLEYKVGNQVMVLVTLRHKASQKPLIVAVTHLKAQDSEANERIRAAQVEELLQQIEILGAQTKEQLQCDKIPVVIAGDFNSDPPHRCSHPNGDSAIARVLAAQESGHKINLQSAYPLVDTFYTTYKIRGPKTTRRVIDYIFYSSDEDNTGLLECVATLSTPKEADLDKTFLPSLRHPSDHLEIGAIFRLL